MCKQYVYTHPSLIKLSNLIFQCFVVVGKLSRASLLNAGVVARQSIVERIVKVPLGVKGTDFGVAQRTPTTMATITTTTGNEGPVLGR